MYISKVSLVNYRNFSNSSFRFNKGINTIIGENGSGKTNLFRGIRLLLDDNLLKLSYKLDKSDFNRNLPNWKGQWIIISVEFDEISPNEEIQSLFVHGSGNAEDETITKSTYNMFFRPKADVRHRLSELKKGDKSALDALLSTLSVDDYETFFCGKSTANFNDPDVYTELVGDFEKVQFKYDIDGSKYGIKIPHQLSVSKEISFTFIKALRDVVSDFHNNRTNPLISLLKSRSSEIDENDYEPISDTVKELNSLIEKLPDVQEIRKDIGDTINDAVGHTYSPSSLSIQSSLSDEADKLLQSLKIFIGEPDEDHEGGIQELSLGGANLIFLTLKLLEYKYQKSRDTFANFLLIEEPEAHIHTHIQKTIFENLDYGDTQIIYSTHSTHISAVSKLPSMNIIGKKRNFSEVYQPNIGLSALETRKLVRYLDAVRSNLLFAKGVILVEGDAEEILIPIIVRTVLGVSLDELGISLINIRSTGFENVAQIFHDDRIRRRCSIITDLDAPIADTTIKNDDPSDVKSAKNRAINSAKAGEERKGRLEKFKADNEWIETFYAKHTFEVDFIESGNAWEAGRLIATVYKDKPTMAKAKEDLKSKVPSVFGKRILTMASGYGKGWFAVLLSEHVVYNTVIPNYILEALIFAKGRFPNELLADLIRHRVLSHNKKDKLDFGDIETHIHELIQSGTRSGVITRLEEVVPDDPIITILKKGD